VKECDPSGRRRAAYGGRLRARAPKARPEGTRANLLISAPFVLRGVRLA
jgi:hypothetical protein